MEIIDKIRFYLLNYKNNPIYDSFTDKEYNAQFKKQRKDICDLLNVMEDENQRLKEAVFFYLDVATGLSSSNYQYDMDKWCGILLDCGYDEAKEKYGNYEYAERWELE